MTKQKPKAPEAHAKLSPSSSERWYNCPGSVNVVAQYPRQDTVYTTEGTVAHGIAADALIKNWGEKDLDRLIGDEVEEGGFTHEVTEEMIEAVWDYVQYVRSFLEEGSILVVEERINLPFISKDVWGTGDAVIINPFQNIHFFDLKYGKGKKVSAYQNKQLLTYFAGWFMQEDVTGGTIHIFQPRVEEGVSSYEVTKEEIMGFIDTLKVKAKEALAKDAPLIAGDWCRQTFCPHQAVCPALAGHARSVMERDFDLEPKGLSILQISRVLDNAKLVSDWISKVQQHAKELAMKGQNVPGYKLVKKLGNRTWSDPQVVEQDFSTIYGDSIYDKPKLKSPAQLEKVIGKNKIDSYVVRPESIALVKETTKGEPIQLTNAQTEFGEN